MRSVIRGIVYDTKIALVMGKLTRGFNQRADEKYLYGRRGFTQEPDAKYLAIDIGLYQTPISKKFFLAGHGGKFTLWKGGERIIPLTEAEAREFAEDFLSMDILPVE